MGNWFSDRWDDVKGAADSAYGWGKDIVTGALGAATDAAGGQFPFLGALGASGGPGGASPGVAQGGGGVAQSTTVNCGGGGSGATILDRRRYVLEGDFLLDTYLGRVWKFDESGHQFVGVPRDMTDGELSAVETAHGWLEDLAAAAKKAGKDAGNAAQKAHIATIAGCLDRLAESGKRDIDRHRQLAKLNRRVTR